MTYLTLLAILVVAIVIVYTIAFTGKDNVFVYGIFPVFISYTEDMNLPWQAGYASGPRVYLLPHYRNDVGMLAHEIQHARQWYKSVGTHGIIKSLSDNYKLAIEVEAYAVQYLSYGRVDRSIEHMVDNAPMGKVPLYAMWISTHYGLKIDAVSAQVMLWQEIDDREGEL